MLKKIEKILKESPGLKGREIAKKIGMTKREVNSFLFKHLNDFVQDNKSYRWILKSVEFKVEFENNKWVNRDSFENSLLSIGSPLDSDCSSVVFIVPAGCSILLDAAARLLALCNQLKQYRTNSDYATFLERVEYFERFN